MFPVYVQLCLYVHISSKMIVWSKTQAIRFFLFHSALQIMVLNIYFFATFFIAQCSGTRRKLPLCRSRKYHSPSLPEGIGISRGWGFCETKILKKHNSNKKKFFPWGRYGYFLELHIPTPRKRLWLKFSTNCYGQFIVILSLQILACDLPTPWKIKWLHIGWVWTFLALKRVWS